MKKAGDPIAHVLVRSLEPVNLEEFLSSYARAIVEVHGTGPTASPRPELVRTATSTSATP